MRVLEQLAEDEYSVILVDGPPGDIGRSGVIAWLRRFYRPGTTLVVDDTDRDEERRLANAIAEEFGLRIVDEVEDKEKNSILLQ
jgi:hypothetical protein